MRISQSFLVPFVDLLDRADSLPPESQEGETAAGAAHAAPPFSLERGDLVYGLHAARQRLFDTLVLAQPRRATSTAAPYMNQSFVNYAMSKTCHAVRSAQADPDDDHPGAITAAHEALQWQDGAAIPAAIDAATAGDRWPPTAGAREVVREMIAYSSQSHLQGTGRYDIAWIQRVASAEDYRAAYKASKLGLVLAAAQRGAAHHIHFALDGLDQRAVVDKTGEHGASITASELRAAYRLRHALEGRVHFYQAGLPCASPWAADPALWRRYEPRHRRQFKP